MSVESEEKWVKNLRESQSALAITCYIDGEIAENCEINFRVGIKISHRATVAKGRTIAKRIFYAKGIEEK